MHPTRPFQLLMVASVAQASWFNFHKEEPRDGLIRRQSGGTSAAAETTTSAAAVTTTTSAAAVTTTTSAAPATTTAPTAAVTTTTPATSPSATIPAISSTVPVETGESTTLRTSVTSAAGNQETTSSGEASSAPSTTRQPVTSTIQTIVYTTNSEGVATSFTSEATVTSTPGLNQSESGDSSSGMSTQTRNTVIGVVVGVGGAIVLGALGFVAWRIWGKKKQAEENDGLMEYNNQYGNDAKVEAGPASSPGAGRTPFQSTLESYHGPSQVNASSNF